MSVLYKSLYTEFYMADRGATTVDTQDCRLFINAHAQVTIMCTEQT